MGIFSETIQGTIDWQKRLLGIPKSIEEAKNAIQSSWQELKTADDGSQYWDRIVDDIKTAGDEGKIALADFGLAVQDFIGSLAAAGKSPLEIKTNLEELRATLPPDLQAVVDQAIAGINGKSNEIPLDLSFDAAGVDAKVAALREQLKTALAAGDYGLANKLIAEIGQVDPALFPNRIKDALASGDFGLAQKLTGEYNAWALARNLPAIPVEADGTPAQGVIDGLTSGKTVPLDVEADTSTAAADIAAAAAGKTVPFDIDITNPLGAASVLDGVAKPRTAKITIDVTNPKGATWVIDQVANKQRTAYIDVKTRGLAAALAAVEAAEQASIGLGQGAAAASRSANMMFSPINMVRVSLDGRELRSVIDDEIRALTPTRQEVA
jgi:hypothetical protein